MKIFVYEYICATYRPGDEDPRAASLLAEGKAMRDAAFADACAVVGAEVQTLDQESREEKEFRRLADWCDYALMIAPEFDGILEQRCRWAEECGATLLGPPADAVALCADKLALAEVWRKAGVPTPPTKLWDPWAFPPPVVVKPRFGVGTTDTFVLKDQAAIERFVPMIDMIVQPYCAGISMSVAFMIGPKQVISLCPCTQDIREDNGQLAYHGGRTCIRTKPGAPATEDYYSPDACAPGLADHVQIVEPGAPATEDTYSPVAGAPGLDVRIHALAKLTIAAVPRLCGYFGVDMVVDATTCNVSAIEINPRLTTSYIGLRKLYANNLMQLLINVIRGEHVSELSCRSALVAFAADGRVNDASSKRR